MPRPKRSPTQDMAAITSKTVRESGVRPEDIPTEAREKALLDYTASKSKSKSSKPSASYESQLRIGDSMKSFITSCIERDTLFPLSERIYSNLDELKGACTDFVVFCLSNDIVMTPTTLSMWLGIDKATIMIALNNGDLDERFTVLKCIRDIMDSVFEQQLTFYEGNPTGKIYVTKARMGWREEAAEINVNHNIYDSRRISDPLEAIQSITEVPTDE